MIRYEKSNISERLKHQIIKQAKRNPSTRLIHKMEYYNQIWKRKFKKETTPKPSIITQWKRVLWNTSTLLILSFHRACRGHIMIWWIQYSLGFHIWTPGAASEMKVVLLESWQAASAHGTGLNGFECSFVLKGRKNYWSDTCQAGNVQRKPASELLKRLSSVNKDCWMKNFVWPLCGHADVAHQ